MVERNTVPLAVGLALEQGKQFSICLSDNVVHGGNRYIEARMEDNGPGIPREHIPHLTERFYRVDSSRSRESGGTGLGLAIVKHVMQRHNGYLTIKSRPGQTRFQVCFPAFRIINTETNDAGATTQPPASLS